MRRAEMPRGIPSINSAKPVDSNLVLTALTKPLGHRVRYNIIQYLELHTNRSKSVRTRQVRFSRDMERL